MLTTDELLQLAFNMRRPIENGWLSPQHAEAVLVVALVKADRYETINRNDFLALHDELLERAGVR